MNQGIYKRYLLVVLMTFLMFNFMDRLALGLVLQDIKVDLRLSDTELGVLSGIAFALFYSVMGLPIARWADRGNRVSILALTASLWSIAVGLCGMATSFVQLLLIRIGVGVGEAGCIPPASSLIADYFTRAERPRAAAFFWQGANLSFIVGYFVAGWISQFYGWRTLFIVMGLPGLVLAVLACFTLKEPRRVKSKMALATANTSQVHTQPNVPAIGHPSLKEVLSTLWANATFRHLLYSFSVFYFFSYGILQWQPAFFVRSFGLQTGELGTWFAVVYGLPSIVGQYAGGEWASRYAPNNERLQLRAMAIANAGFNTIIWALTYCSHDYRAALGWMALSTLGGVSIIGPMLALTQTLVPARMRAMSVAIVLLFANLIGLGLGPLAVGIASDVLQPFWGQQSLRYALLAFTPGYLWVSWHLWRASKTVTQDLALVSSDDCEVATSLSCGDDGATTLPALSHGR